MEAIRDNYMALYGVEELSAQLGVSKCHLVRVFSSEMGMPPGRFLTNVRIEAAKLLLAEREYSLEMIAGLCGFSGANYLCRVFKRETGLSPAAWRETAAHKAAKPMDVTDAEDATTKSMCKSSSFCIPIILYPYIKKKHLCIQKQPISYRDRRGYAS